MIHALLFLLICAFQLNAAEHTDQGTEYGTEGIDIYVQTKHGPDGSLFLDPYFIPYITQLNGETLLDAGCGGGPWSILAAQNGANVYGVDIQEGMISKAQEAAQRAGMQQLTNFVVGDVCQLPYESHFFNRALSLNVGCNLPHLQAHIAEMYRVLKRGGFVIITAPTSFGVLFADGEHSQLATIRKIEKLLLESGEAFPESIGELDEVLRATFAKRNSRWCLILDENQLTEGEEIWRKIPKMVVPNRYHPEEEYVALLQQEGFQVKAIYRPHFASEVEWKAYNQKQRPGLGKEYVGASPFVIFVAEK